MGKIVQKTFENLNKELRELRHRFIIDNNIRCENCQRFVNGKCKSKVYCIVNDNVMVCAYVEKPDLAKIQPVNVYSDLSKEEYEQLSLEAECTNLND